MEAEDINKEIANYDGQIAATEQAVGGYTEQTAEMQKTVDEAKVSFVEMGHFRLQVTFAPALWLVTLQNHVVINFITISVPHLLFVEI